MKINLIVVDECNTSLVAETIDSNMQTILGDNLENYIKFRLNDLSLTYPEARWIYREDEKTLGEIAADKFQEAYESWLEYAKEHPEEVEWDPEEWAYEQARYEAESEWW